MSAYKGLLLWKLSSHHKQLENQAKYMGGNWGIGQQTYRYVPEGREMLMGDYDCSNLLAGQTAQAVVQPRGTQIEPVSLTEFRGQRLQFKEAEVARMCGKEYQKGVAQRRRAGQLWLGLWLSLALWVMRKEPLRSSRPSSSWSSHGWEQFSLPPGGMKRLCNIWSIRQSAQKCLTLVVGVNSP